MGNIVTHFKTNQFQNDHLEIDKFDWSNRTEKTANGRTSNVLEKTKKSIQCPS